MKKFIQRSILLIIPILIWGITVYLIDPFNYFGLSLVKDEAKKSAEQLNTLMYRTIKYIRYPGENMLIGDSRANALSEAKLEEVSGEEYEKLVIWASKFNELFDLFYLANETKPLKKVVIGVNFNMFNKYGYDNRVEGLKKMLDKPLMYLFNADVAEATFYTLQEMLFHKEVSMVPEQSKEEFWDWSLKVKATHWYQNYGFPDKLYDELLAFDNFTKENNIEVTFILVPHHIDFHNRLIDFGLEAEEQRFKEIMSGLNAHVYDYDFPNEITTNKLNYDDPVHYNDSIGDVIIEEVFTNNFSIGKVLSK